MPSKQNNLPDEAGVNRDTSEPLIQNVVHLVSQNRCYSEVEPILEYFSSSDKKRELRHYELEFCAVVKPGSNEGTLIEVFLEGIFDQSGEKRLHAATFKTLSTDVKTFRTLGTLCGELSYYAHEYINANIKRYFLLENKHG